VVSLPILGKTSIQNTTGMVNYFKVTLPINSGYCFVFKLRPERVIYKPTGYNDHFMYLNLGTETLYNGFGMGGQMK
jgi:hypothetical protein